MDIYFRAWVKWQHLIYFNSIDQKLSLIKRNTLNDDYKFKQRNCTEEVLKDEEHSGA